MQRYHLPLFKEENRQQTKVKERNVFSELGFFPWLLILLTTAPQAQLQKFSTPT